MKKLSILLFIAILIIHSGVNAENYTVSGKVLLENKTDHRNVKVIFYPTSPSAKLDSTYTNSDGSYVISIEAGIYKVIFSKIGYQDYMYHDFENIIISDSETLNDVILEEGIFNSVSGNISGKWNDSITYIIDGDVTIPLNQKLSIGSGTRIKFNGNYSIIVEGQLIAIGTEDNRILFTSNKNEPQENDWGFIRFNNGVVKSRLSYSIIEYGRIYCNNSSPDITHNIVRYFSERGIDAYYGSPYIAHNRISDYIEGLYHSGIGIITQYSNSIVEFNEVSSGSGYGIDLWGGTPVAKGNRIYNVSGDGYGISIGGSNGRAVVSNNMIYNCKIGVYIDCWYKELDKPSPFILNNTIINNSFAGISYESGQYAAGKIYLNIISNNNNGINCSSSSSKPAEIMYNIIYGNNMNFSNIISIIGLGEIIATNNNGTACDSYYNIFQDPLLDIFQISNNSPCIDAGSNNLVESTDIDFYGNERIWDGNGNGIATVDMGAYEYGSPVKLAMHYLTQSPSHCDSINGIIDLTVMGGQKPYEYIWSNGATTEDLINIASGNYSVTITDAGKNSIDTTILVSCPNIEALSLEYSTTSPSHCDSTNGIIDITVMGGQKPYEYIWSNGATTEDLINIASGNYSVTITDAIKNSIDTTITIACSATGTTMCSISGSVLAGGSNITSGVVQVFAVSDSCKTKPIAYGRIQNDGTYTIEDINKGKYLVYAVPNPDSYSNYYPGYYVNKLHWSTANSIELIGQAQNVNIELQEVVSLPAGSLLISGVVTYEDSSCYEQDIYGNYWFPYSYSAPSAVTNIAPNIPVWLYKDSEPVAWAISDNKGEFKFENLPAGVYKLLGEKAGYSVTAASNINLSNDNITDAVVIIRESDIVSTVKSNPTNTMRVYPNPVTDVLNIEALDINESTIDIQIFSSLGTQVGLWNMVKADGQTFIPININQYSPGVYSVVVTNNNTQQHYKIMKY